MEKITPGYDNPLRDSDQEQARKSLEHNPVLLNEVLAGLEPRNGGVYVDATWGRGGYTQAILGSADCFVLGMDCDPAAAEIAQARADAWFDLPVNNRKEDIQINYSGGQKKLSRNGQFVFARCCFSRIDEAVGVLESVHPARTGGGEDHKFDGVNGIVFDLGLSSPQLDDPKRGFSFRYDSDLDMRMRVSGQTAAEWLEYADESDIARVLRDYGDERFARRIAKHIVMNRKKTHLRSTRDLANLVHKVIGQRSGSIDSATRTFQAIRIHINDEYSRLERALAESLDQLASGGRLVVVSYHSGEDRIIKACFRRACGLGVNTAGILRLPTIDKEVQINFSMKRRRVIRPGDKELKANPRSRSARLRIIERINRNCV